MFEQVRKIYEACIMCVLFDNNYVFEDVLTMGVSTSKEQTLAMTFEDIERLRTDFEPNEVTITGGRSEYDEPILVVKYGSGYAHYYCLFTPKSDESIVTEEVIK